MQPGDDAIPDRSGTAGALDYARLPAYVAAYVKES
jgi:hypothetical protein